MSDAEDSALTPNNALTPVEARKIHPHPRVFVGCTECGRLKCGCATQRTSSTWDSTMQGALSDEDLLSMCEFYFPKDLALNSIMRRIWDELAAREGTPICIDKEYLLRSDLEELAVKKHAPMLKTAFMAAVQGNCHTVDSIVAEDRAVRVLRLNNMPPRTRLTAGQVWIACVAGVCGPEAVRSACLALKDFSKSCSDLTTCVGRMERLEGAILKQTRQASLQHKWWTFLAEVQVSRDTYMRGVCFHAVECPLEEFGHTC